MKSKTVKFLIDFVFVTFFENIIDCLVRLICSRQVDIYFRKYKPNKNINPDIFSLFFYYC